MRILLDENTPRGVSRILMGHDVRTVPEMGWAAYSNGQLLDEAEQAGFDALVTCDQNLVFQQNLAGRNIAVVILSTNIWPIIRKGRAGRRLPGACSCRAKFRTSLMSWRTRSMISARRQKWEIFARFLACRCSAMGRSRCRSLWAEGSLVPSVGDKSSSFRPSLTRP